MKYLDKIGLTYLWNKLKDKIPMKVSDLTNDSKFVSSDNITSILVVDELPEEEENGVLYLVRQNSGSSEEYVEYPTMELGSISTSSGTNKEESGYCRTSDYLYVEGCSYITVNHDGGTDVRPRVFFYDENKNFMTAWNRDGETYYSYASIANGGRVERITGAKYMKIRIGVDTIPTVQLTYDFN